MKIFVIGGSGFLGSHLVPKLVSAGHEVTVLTRRESEVARLESAGARPVLGDILDCEAFLPKLPSQDVVIFVAKPFSPGRIAERKFRQLKKIATAFGTNALMVARRLEATLIYTCGTTYLTRPGEVADESWPLVPIGLGRIGEDAIPIMEKARASGSPPLIVMLPGQIYGPGGSFEMMVGMMKSGRYRVIGSGANRFPRIHVEDCAQSYLLAAEQRPVGHSFILADDECATMREFSNCMADCLGKRRPKNLPAFVIRLVMGKYLHDTITMDCVVSNAKVKRVLGLELAYPTYREGVRAAVASLARARG